ncbi:hypothetical protein AGMMS49982_10840 [Bacteroidia bacterium]|nr:hypothetical protein AGMMS49982_10840 [Bacteroidia bacterium]
MKGNAILSIIVPVYNVEKYIEKCLDSLLNQDLADYEIIAINDGSTDGSSNILEKYALKQDNIIVVNQENKGPGGARNTGLKKAKGEYLMFVDSDDYIEPNSLSILINQIRADESDILYANFIKVDTNGSIVEKQPQEQMTRYTTDIVDSATFFSKHFGFACYPYLFIFRKKFLIKSNFLFKENIYLEDVEAISKILVSAKKISMCDYPFYYYVQTPQSIMRDDDKYEKRLNDLLIVTQSLTEFKDNEIKEEKVRLWFDGLIAGIVIFLCKSVADKKIKSYNFAVHDFLNRINVFPINAYKRPFSYKIMAKIINKNWNMAVTSFGILKNIK